MGNFPRIREAEALSTAEAFVTSLGEAGFSCAYISKLTIRPVIEAMVGFVPVLRLLLPHPVLVVDISHDVCSFAHPPSATFRTRSVFYRKINNSLYNGFTSFAFFNYSIYEIICFISKITEEGSNEIKNTIINIKIAYMG